MAPISAPDALKLAVQIGSLCARPSLARTRTLLPPGLPSGTRAGSLARAILGSLIERNRYEADWAAKKLEATLGGPLPATVASAVDAPDARAALLAVVAPLLPEGSFESLAFGLGLAMADLHVEARTADAAGMVLELIAPPERDAMVERYRAALEAIVVARTRVVSAAEAFDAALDSRPLSPAVRAAARRVVEAAHGPLPAFDAPGAHRAYGTTSWLQPDWRHPGQRYGKSLVRSLEVLVEAFGFPEEPGVTGLPSPEEADALVALLARPDDDEARLRWAALADARHDPRALLVVEQLAAREERRKRPYSGRVDTPLARSLIERHTEWAAPLLALGARDVTFRRGFVEGITIEAWVYLGRAPALHAAAPILHVKLLGAAPLLRHLLESGILSRLLSIDLSAQGLEDAHVEQLARADGLGSLRALDLRGNRITEAGARALFASTSLPALVHAPLDGNPCGSLYAEAPWDDGMPPSEAWERTPLGERLAAEHGPRRWAFPWASGWPPDLDVLTLRP